MRSLDGTGRETVLTSIFSFINVSGMGTASILEHNQDED